MTMSTRGMKLLAFIMAVAIVLSGLVYSPKAAKAADSAKVPTVEVLGASLRLGQNNGTQSMRMAIQVNNASAANGCALQIKIGNSSVYVHTNSFALGDGMNGPVHDSVYSKDAKNDSIVYAVVLSNIPMENFANYETSIGITGHVQYEPEVTEGEAANNVQLNSGEVVKTVKEVVNNMAAVDYPGLHIKADGNLYIGDKILGQDNVERTAVVDLNAVAQKDSGYVDYDENNNMLVNDTREDTDPSASDASTELHFPLPYPVQPGQWIEVTVSGKSWGSNDFRIWTTPSDGKTSGSYVHDNGIYLNPTINEEDNSYVGTVKLQAIGEECNNLTFKPQHGFKIKDLVISSISVKYLPMFNLATNGDFSDGNVGWSSTYGNTPTVSEDGYGVCANRGNTYAGPIYVVDRRFAEGDIVEFEFDVKLDENYTETDRHFIYQFVTSVNGNETNGPELACKDTKDNPVYGATDKWTRVKGSYEIPAYTDKLPIKIMQGSYKGFDVPSAATFYIDNLYISTKNTEPDPATPAPEPTATPEPEYPTVPAYQAEDAPNIDGLDNDGVWADIPWQAISNRCVKNDALSPTTSLARTKIAWDSQYLYGLIVVEDSEISAEADDNNTHLRDGIEIFMDEDRSRQTIPGGDSGQWSVNPDAFQYRYTGFAASTPNTYKGFAFGNTSYEITMESTKTNTGYIVEYKVKFQNAKQLNDRVAFDCIVQDCVGGDRYSELYLSDANGGRGYNYWNVEHALALNLNFVDVAPKATAAPEPTATPKPTVTPEPTNIYVELSEKVAHPANCEWYFTNPADNTYNNDGSVTLPLKKDGNPVVGFYFNNDKSGVDLSKYDKLEMVVSSDIGGVITRAAITNSKDFKFDQNTNMIGTTSGPTINTTDTLITIPLGDVDGIGYGVGLQHVGWGDNNNSPSNPVITIKSISLINNSAPTPTPKPTAVPTPTYVYEIDLSDEDTWDVDGGTVAYNSETGLLEASFANYQGVAFIAPTGYDFTAVEVTYTSSYNLNPFVFGSAFNGQITNGSPGQSDRLAKQKITATNGETTQIWTDPEDVIRAIKFVTMDGSTDINFKSVKFLSYENVATPVPTATPSPYETKYAYQVTTAINIDGVADEIWDTIPWSPMVAKVKAQGDNSSTTIANTKIAWDENNLYCLVHVKDAEISKANPAAHLKDGIEFFLDENASRETGYENNTDAFQYRIAGLDGTLKGQYNLIPENNGFETSSGPGSLANNITSDCARYSIDSDGKGYMIEYKIPFNNGGRLNKTMAFDMMVNDSDSITRNFEIYYSSVTSSPKYYGLGDAYACDLKLVEALDYHKVDLSNPSNYITDNLETAANYNNGVLNFGANNGQSIAILAPNDGMTYTQVDVVLENNRNLHFYLFGEEFDGANIGNGAPGLSDKLPTESKSESENKISGYTPYALFSNEVDSIKAVKIIRAFTNVSTGNIKSVIFYGKKN